MKHNITNIITAGSKEVPHGTEIMLSQGNAPGTVRVTLRLPGRQDFTSYGNLAIHEGIVELPVKLVFISYASEDLDKIEELAVKLEHDNFMVWLDKDTLLPGDDWKTKIEEGIENSDYVLVFLSKTSIAKTGYVQKELKYALEQWELRPEGKRYIIPILLEECDPPRKLHDIHWLRIWEPDAYTKLVAAMKG